MGCLAPQGSADAPDDQQGCEGAHDAAEAGPSIRRQQSDVPLPSGRLGHGLVLIRSDHHSVWISYG